MSLLVLAVQARATVCGVPVMPVPEVLIVEGELVASLLIETLPATAPVVVGANCTVRVADWFGVNISPAVTPLVLKPAPVTVTPEMVTFALPLLVTATLSELLLPSFTLPKLKLEVLNPSTLLEATPVPLSEMDNGEPGALLSSEIEPEAAPLVVGAKTALKVMFLPARMVTGALIPEMLKPAPVTLTEEMVKVAEPPFVTVIVWELLVPVETLPKAALGGVAEICGWVPTPVMEMVVGELGALLLMVIVPFALPALVGANCALNEVPWPAASVMGVVSPLMLKPAPEAVA